MKGIILHGGSGTRLRPITHTGPKQLIPIANRPNSQFALEDLKHAGIMEIAIVLGEIYPDKVREYYGDGARFGVNITYIHQGKPQGIAHAVGLCREFVGHEQFVVYLGDNLLRGGIQDYAKEFVKSSADAMFLLTEVKDPGRFGVAKLGKGGELLGVVEKPKTPPSDYALVGIYFFTPKIFNVIENLQPSQRGELEITDAIDELIRSGTVTYGIVSGWWKDTGTVQDLLEANRLVLDEMPPRVLGKIEDQSSLQGRVSVGRGSTVKKGALIRGPASIADYSLISDGVYVGPYTSIGSRVVIRAGEIENSVVMDSAEIDIDDRLVDSLIGPGVKVTSSHKLSPRGKRLLLGENSSVFI